MYKLWQRACLFLADFQVTAWTETPFTVTTGTGTATISGSVTTKVAVNEVPGYTLFTAAATGASSCTITSGNTGSVMQISAAGVVTLVAGKSLDFEPRLSTPKL
ncbi:hypothetical protein DPMN_188103 [Dreissena polymorpha]|uniref:BIG2 domain-containing protein n=1 Tax=Dreissena polymorpha TaxID=45954 RepID=A0A9D4DRG4_DREPO|nr:hypothetical protein DPMN_188103 [Dreissena polymorpha]